MDTDQLIAQLSSEAPTKKPMASPARLAGKWLLGLAVYSVLLFALIEVRSDILQKLQSPLFLLELVLLLGIITTTTLSAATLSFPDLYQKPAMAQLPRIFFALFTVLMLFQSLKAPSVAPLAMVECMCTLFITIYAFLPAIWLFYMMRHATSTKPAVAGSVIVLSAFSLGALMLRLSEPNDSAMHFIVFHYFPMLAAAFVGVVLGRKLLRW